MMIIFEDNGVVKTAWASDQRHADKIIPPGAWSTVSPPAIVPSGVPPEYWVIDRNSGTIGVSASAIDHAKKKASEEVDIEAERVRLKYITPGDGMQITYREKLEQAEHVAAGGQAAADAMSADNAAANYPVLSASIGIEASSLWLSAQLVISRYSAWATKARAIELRRLTAKKAITEATSIESVNSVLASTQWGDL